MDTNTQKSETQIAQRAPLSFFGFMGRVVLYTVVYVVFLQIMNTVLDGSPGYSFLELLESMFEALTLISIFFAPVVIAIISLLVLVSRNMSPKHKSLVFFGVVLIVALGATLFVLES